MFIDMRKSDNRIDFIIQSIAHKQDFTGLSYDVKFSKATVKKNVAKSLAPIKERKAGKTNVN